MKINLNVNVENIYYKFKLIKDGMFIKRDDSYFTPIYAVCHKFEWNKNSINVKTKQKKSTGDHDEERYINRNVADSSVEKYMYNNGSIRNTDDSDRSSDDHDKENLKHPLYDNIDYNVNEKGLQHFDMYNSNSKENQSIRVNINVNCQEKDEKDSNGNCSNIPIDDDINYNNYNDNDKDDSENDVHYQRLTIDNETHIIFTSDHDTFWHDYYGSGFNKLSINQKLFIIALHVV